MKILSRSTCLWLALVLLFAGFAGPLLAGDEADPMVAKGAVAVPKPPGVKEAAPVTAGSTSLRISSLAFRPIFSSTNMEYYSPGYMYASSDPTLPWSVSVNLPQGAVVTKVRMYYYNTNANTSCQAWFQYFDLDSEAFYSAVNFFSTHSSGLSYDDSGTFIHTIDNTKYCYTVGWRPNVSNNTMRLKGIEIFYTPPPGRGAAVIPLN
jgi:hypothetical protein